MLEFGKFSESTWQFSEVFCVSVFVVLEVMGRVHLLNLVYAIIVILN